MNTISSSTSTKGNAFRWKFWIITLALLASLILSFLTWLEICVEHCSANQEYYLFGLPFALVGIAFFAVLITLHLLSTQYEYLSRIVGWFIASAVGAEVMFNIIQTNEIGHLCPLCISIAVSVCVAAAAFLTDYIKSLKETIQLHNRGRIMQKVKQGLAGLSFLMMGFLMAFVAVSKPDFAEAAMNDMKDKMAFGTKNSPVEMYFITDWFCPSCQKVEPMIEKLYPEIKSKVAFYFIDYPIHKKSLNFSPYNLSFMVYNKPEYFKTRHLLVELTNKTTSPKDEDVAKAVKKIGIGFKELSFVDIKSGLEFFDTVVEKYNIHATPTIIITSPQQNKMVKLEGRDEISKEKILEAIDKVNSSK